MIQNRKGEINMEDSFKYLANWYRAIIIIATILIIDVVALLCFIGFDTYNTLIDVNSNNNPGSVITYAIAFIFAVIFLIVTDKYTSARNKCVSKVNYKTFKEFSLNKKELGYAEGVVYCQLANAIINNVYEKNEEALGLKEKVSIFSLITDKYGVEIPTTHLREEYYSNPNALLKLIKGNGSDTEAKKNAKRINPYYCRNILNIIVLVILAFSYIYSKYANQDIVGNAFNGCAMLLIVGDILSYYFSKK